MHLAILVSFSGQGGVERMMLNLMAEMARSVTRIDLLTLRMDSPFLSDFLASKPDNLHLVPLASRHSFPAIPSISRYLRHRQPDVLLVAKDRAGRAALVARHFSGWHGPVVIRLGTNLSASLEARPPLQRWLRKTPMRWLYPMADQVVAVSDGVRQDTLEITGVEEHKVSVIRNPVIAANCDETATQPSPHPWLDQPTDMRQCPVALAVGRLSHQKDFSTLLQAVAQVHRAQPLRLIILGEGKLRSSLEAQIKELGLENSVALPGFQARPQDWLRRASLFVLSSRWEGSPNALTEALALGVPAVSTNCPSGPDELLGDGRFGPLVPVADATAMAAAILDVLANPQPAEVLRQATAAYRADYSARQYLRLLSDLAKAKNNKA